mmetsp:Transcript_133911/g.317496  ORF Transcript_133911/g.317496 Transcript_133911/m.317496 type:complete len:133 (+) Transcript_133911:76-474(+)
MLRATIGIFGCLSLLPAVAASGAASEGQGVEPKKGRPLYGASWNMACHLECREQGFSSSMCEKNGMSPHKFCNCYDRLHITPQTCSDQSASECLHSCRNGCTSVGFTFGVLLQETGHCCCYSDWKPLGKKCE